MMEKYRHYPEGKLVEVMKMATIAMMRPDISIDNLGVNTYKELIDMMMMEVSKGTMPNVLVTIERDLKEIFRVSNIRIFGSRITL